MEPQSLLSIKAKLQQQRLPLYRNIIKWTWILLGFGFVSALLIILIISFSAIPSFRELENPQSAEASEVLATNGELLGRYFTENRVPVQFDDLNPHIVNALVATEDARYWNHCGVDSRAIARVMVRTILLRDQSAGGGSTITQQLAKMLYSDRDFSGKNKIQKAFSLIYWKLREWITAVKLEKSYTKEEIMSMYLNQVDFVNYAFGIQAAAEVYFGVNQEDLTVEEAATIVGMLQNPARYNPMRFPDRCMRRRMVVLSQMARYDFLTKPQYDSLKVVPLDMSRFKRVTYSDDKAPYMCSELKKELDDILSRPEHRKPDGSKYNIYSEGLKIYTTIDPIYQQHAEAAMEKHMKKIQKRFFTVWKNRDPWRYKTSETTDDEIKGRQAKLNREMRFGDRYNAIRPKFMDRVVSEVAEEYDFELRDADILRMMQEERDRGHINKLVGKGIATSEQAVVYRKIMKTGLWAQIKTQWRALQVEVKKQYNTKAPMRVFSWYGPKFERDTVMTPLDSLRYHRMFLQTGMLAVDPLSSEIKAWVGGINFKYFKFNHTDSKRQVGSTFKPFIYATAIAQQSISPCFPIYDHPVTIPPDYGNFHLFKSWTPKNATGTYSGKRLTLKEGLKHSVNTVSAYLMKQMGDTRPVRGLVHNMGIDSSGIPDAPSICLGAADISVIQMTGAYASFANNGVYGKPFVIRKIEDKNGKIIYRHLPEERIALQANANYVMTQMLKYNVAGAPGIRNLKSEVGGKTGTTNDYSDGWFMGVTPRLVVGTWVGGDDRWIRFRSLADGQGSRMARPIFAEFIRRLEADKKSGYDFNARFKRPPGDLGIELDCSQFDYASDQSSDEESFTKDIYSDEVPEGGVPPDAGFEGG